MGVPIELFQKGDVYIDYELEEVMFRYDFKSKKCYRKFYGDSTEQEIPYDNDLYNKSMSWGELITSEIYNQGKSVKP